MSNKIEPINFAVTPKSWDHLYKKIESLSGSEKTIAMYHALMAWNLACKITNEGEVEYEC